MKNDDFTKRRQQMELIKNGMVVAPPEPGNVTHQGSGLGNGVFLSTVIFCIFAWTVLSYGNPNLLDVIILRLQLGVCF